MRDHPFAPPPTFCAGSAHSPPRLLEGRKGNNVGIGLGFEILGLVGYATSAYGPFKNNNLTDQLGAGVLKKPAIFL